jgi:hypothetical protein
VSDRMICRATGKRSFRTKREADAEMARFRRRAGRQPVKSYQCDACLGFHLTAEHRKEQGR